MKIINNNIKETLADDLLINLITKHLEFLDQNLEAAMAEYQSCYIENMLAKVPVIKDEYPRRR